VPLLVCFLLAASVAETHRARAGNAEALGRMRQAAREYEAAWEEEQEPDLLYRLGIARRKLKEYAKAREALRGYLRVAPQGGLRHEVERQLNKLDVLLEAAAEVYSDPPSMPSDEAAAPRASGTGCAVPRSPHGTLERVALAPPPPRWSVAAWLALGAAAGIAAAGLLRRSARLARRGSRAAT
jgi:tetratricopeptide (TPR) repeat protein